MTVFQLPQLFKKQQPRQMKAIKLARAPTKHCTTLTASSMQQHDTSTCQTALEIAGVEAKSAAASAVHFYLAGSPIAASNNQSLIVQARWNSCLWLAFAGTTTHVAWYHIKHG